MVRRKHFNTQTSMTNVPHKAKRKACYAESEYEAENEIRKDFYSSELRRAPSPTPAPCTKRRPRSNFSESTHQSVPMSSTRQQISAEPKAQVEHSNAEEEYVSAAFVFQRYPLDHEYCKVAVRQLVKKISAEDNGSSQVLNAQIQSVTDRLRFQGLDVGTADRVRAELSIASRRSKIIRLGEGLQDLLMLANLLEDLCAGVKVPKVHSALAACLQGIRLHKGMDTDAVYMSGALPPRSEAGLPPTPVSERTQTVEPQLECAMTTLDVPALQARGNMERIAKFKERFPEGSDLFVFHVREACLRSGFTGPGFENRIKQARRMWHELGTEKQKSWQCLCQQVHTGDSKPMNASVGDELLRRHGITTALGLTDSESNAVPSASASSRIYGGQIDAIHTDADATTMSLLTANAYVSPSARRRASYRATNVFFTETFNNRQRLAWIFNTPDGLNTTLGKSRFREACMKRFGKTVVPGSCRQTGNRLYSISFQNEHQVSAILASKACIVVDGVVVYPEKLPSEVPNLFVADLSGSGVTKEDLSSCVQRVMGYFQYELAAYPSDCFAIEFSEPRPLLRFYVPMEGRGGQIQQARFDAVESWRACSLCAKKHRSLCPKAPRLSTSWS